MRGFMLPRRAPVACATSLARPAHIGAAILVPPMQQLIAATPAPPVSSPQ